MRVAAVGLASGEDRAANRAAAVDAVHAAADGGADLVVLPEYAAWFDPRGVGVGAAEPLDGPFVAALAGAARERGLVVVAGTVVAGADTARGRNVVVAVGPHGVLGAYAKVHLYDAFGQRESDRLEPGDPADPPLVVDVGGTVVGVLTCYDLRFPESARRLLDAGADVLVVPAAWAAGEHKEDHWRTLLRARAIEGTVWTVGAPMAGRGVAGVPLVVDPWGTVRAEAAAGGVAACEVDPDVVGRARRANPSLLNRRYAVVVAADPPGAAGAQPAE